MHFRHAKTTRLFLLATLFAVLALFGAIVWAQTEQPDPEGGQAVPFDSTAHQGEVELQDLPGAGAPAGDAVGVSQDPEAGNTRAFNPASAADHEELELDPDAPATELTLFQFVAASSFYPRETTTTHQYGGAGCVYRTTTSGFLVSDFQLPQGAEIEYLRLYFYDNNPDQDATLWLYAYDGVGGYAELAKAESSGTPGQSSVGSGFFSYEVDNSVGSLSLVAAMDAANNSTVLFCGARVRYTVDVPTYTLLPSVLK